MSGKGLFFVLYFNSKVVRLKAQPHPIIKPVILQFQFQSGAVKRIAKSLIRYRLHLFQFQSGAVKRGICRKIVSTVIHYFNSKVVRLKVSLLSLVKLQTLDFNSKVVRLKDVKRSLALGT